MGNIMRCALQYFLHNFWQSLSYAKIFFKNPHLSAYFYWFYWKKKGKDEREREGVGERDTGNQTRDPSVLRTMLQPTEPQWPGLCKDILNVLVIIRNALLRVSWTPVFLPAIPDQITFKSDHSLISSTAQIPNSSLLAQITLLSHCSCSCRRPLCFQPFPCLQLLYFIDIWIFLKW